ncbi:MAG: DUF4105 domain-containing protein, partial [Tannerella sp.]|nr:DUF4105 domain-containing protein [Tannerella sp.]
MLLFIFSITAKAQAQLSEQAQISLMTCSPTDEAVYTLYGHTALRVYDPDNKIDIVFNYGLFDTSRPFFMYHFVKGELDYMLGWTSFNN